VGASNTNTIIVDFADTTTTGYISVTPMNACGAGMASSLLINIDTVQSQSICAATVDSTSSKNVLIWEKPVSTTIDSFRVYREIASAYFKIGTVAYTSLSEFTDTTNGVNPNITSYKYKVSSVDSCGHESMLSEFHRTIHLAVSVANPPASFNLAWNDYLGFAVMQYRILRNVNSAGFVAVDSTSFGNTAWTDTASYLPSDTVAYVIEIDHPNGCTSSALASTEATNLNSSRSNVYRTGGTPTGYTAAADDYFISVSPNPTRGLFTITTGNFIPVGTVQIFNTLGEEVKRLNFNPSEKTLSVDMLGYAKGVYQVQIRNANTVVNKKIVIQ
jgi:galactitol-specific phosphotransferase system IIB component